MSLSPLKFFMGLASTKNSSTQEPSTSTSSPSSTSTATASSTRAANTTSSRPADSYTTARPPDRANLGAAKRFDQSQPPVKVGFIDALFGVGPQTCASPRVDSGRTMGDHAAAAIHGATVQWLEPWAGSGLADIAGAAASTLVLEQVSDETRPILDSSGRFQLDALKSFGQTDFDSATLSDGQRGAASASVLAMALRGKPSLLGAVDQARARLQANIAELHAAPDKLFDKEEAERLRKEPDPRLEIPQRLLAGLDDIAKGIRENKASVRDLNRLADTLHFAYSGTLARHSDLSHDAAAQMNRDLGLVPSGIKAPSEVRHPSSVGTVHFSLEPSSWGNMISGPDLSSETARGARAQVAQRILDQIPAGQSALVGIYDLADSYPFLKTESEMRPSHSIGVGKNQCGEVYVYDSGSEPHYRTGPEAVAHLQARIGVLATHSKEASNARSRAYELFPAATVLLQSQGGTID